MKHWKLYLLSICACAALAGCTKSVRSISNSGYQPDRAFCGYRPADNGSDPAFTYRGELSESDVLGITRKQTSSEADIIQTLDGARRVKLSPDSSILLIQSGAIFPDATMVAELSKHFRVVPFSGLPSCASPASTWHTREIEPQSYAKSLRLVAAQGGNDIILCYWGILESDKENLPTKTISWVPGVNWLVPDETQYKRIRLKMALIDVRSGNWTVFSPPAFQDSSVNRSPRRAAADQKLVESLKQKAYVTGVKDLVQLYAQN